MNLSADCSEEADDEFMHRVLEKGAYFKMETNDTTTAAAAEDNNMMTIVTEEAEKDHPEDKKGKQPSLSLEN